MEDDFMKYKHLVQNTLKEDLLDIDSINREELEKILYDELILGKSLYIVDTGGKITRLNPNTDFIVRDEKKKPLSNEEARARLKHLVEINSVEE